MTKEKILKALSLQEEIEGSIENKDLILKILGQCQRSSEVETFFGTRFFRYGLLSYEVHRFWFIKPHLLPLLK